MLEMEIQGERIRGRPKQSCMDCVMDDLREKQLLVEYVHD